MQQISYDKHLCCGGLGVNGIINGGRKVRRGMCALRSLDGVWLD